MITYEAAKKTALRINPKVNMYAEYSDVFIFSDTKAQEHEAEDSSIVIRKLDGMMCNYTEFILDPKNKNRSAQLKLIV